MKAALLGLLQDLEAIQDKCDDNLGDTNIRDHMGEDIHNGFLIPKPKFEPSGEYGLEPAVNRKVAKAIAKFCKAANKAAGKEGLTTFRQRVAAFQDSRVKTKQGSDYNEFFGSIPLKNYDEHGNRIGADGNVKPKPTPLAWTFEFKGTMDELCASLEAAKPKWEWWLNKNYRTPFIDVFFNKGGSCMIDTQSKPKKGLRADMKDQFDRDLQPFGEELVAILKKAGATKITATQPKGRH